MRNYLPRTCKVEDISYLQFQSGVQSLFEDLVVPQETFFYNQRYVRSIKKDVYKGENQTRIRFDFKNEIEITFQAMLFHALLIFLHKTL